MKISNTRLTSLDFFRGATVAAMIVVNYPGSWNAVYGQLTHAEWVGCTVTDLIFPFFLFIVGVSIAIAFSKSLARGLNKKEFLLKSLKRGIIIFVLGLFLNLFPNFNFSEFRIPGVLQRIALVYLACAVLYLFANKKGRYIWFVSLLSGYYLIMTFIPVPGIGQANLDPLNNFAAWFDRLILSGNIGRCGKGLYDITGIFTTIPAIASGLIGIFVGDLLLTKKRDDRENLFGCSLQVGF